MGALGYGSQTISILGHDPGGNVAYAYARLFPASVSREMVLETALNGYGLESLYNVSFHFLFNMQPSTVTEGMVNNVASSDAYLNYMYSFVHEPGRYHRPGQADLGRRLCLPGEPRGRLQLLPGVP